jgi:hypothetical protein
MKFVTAIYNNLHFSTYGGRLNRNFHYLYSLRCLAGMGQDIICYTTLDEMESIKSYLLKYNITNVYFEIFDLSSMYCHKDIQRIKLINAEEYKHDNIWENRCVELMWLKPFWLKQQADKYPNEKLFWIDAGLSHGGIIPQKYNSAYSTEVEQSHQNDLAFSPKLVKKLDDWSSDALFAFYCINRQHQYPERYANDEPLSGSIVAGLFGGTHDTITFVNNEFEKIVNELVSYKLLMPEELILTLIYKKFPNMFNVFEFGTWYHDDWSFYEPSMQSFSIFFEDFQ